MKAFLLSLYSLLLLNFAVRGQQTSLIVPLSSTHGISTGFEKEGADSSLHFVRVERIHSNLYARTGENSLLLNGKSANAYFTLSKLLPVVVDEQISVKVYVTYTQQKRASSSALLLAGAAVGSVVQSQQPVLSNEQPNVRQAKNMLPYIGVGVALIPNGLRIKSGRSRAYLQCSVYNADTVLVESRQVPVDKSAKDNWQQLSLHLSAAANGFVQVLFVNEGKQLVRADDFTVRIADASSDSLLTGFPIRTNSISATDSKKRNSKVLSKLNLQRSGGCAGICGHYEDNYLYTVGNVEHWEQCYVRVQCDGPEESRECFPYTVTISLPNDCHGVAGGDSYDSACGCLYAYQTCNCDGVPDSGAHQTSCGCLPAGAECPDDTGGGGDTSGPNVDCNGQLNGTAQKDECGTCVGGTTGKSVQLFYRDADADGWGDVKIYRFCYAPGSGWVTRNGDYNDNCYDLSNANDQCACSSNVSADRVDIVEVVGGTPYVYGPDDYGLTGINDLRVTITACKQGNLWRAAVVSIEGVYRTQSRLLPSVSEVTGIGGNTNSNNYCVQVADLKTLGVGTNPQWYILNAVQVHENVHISTIGKTLHSNTGSIEAQFESLTVADSPGKTKAMAISQLTNSSGFAQARIAALRQWDGDFQIDYKRFDHAGDTDRAEHGVVDPMITEICNYAKRFWSSFCPDCP